MFDPVFAQVEIVLTAIIGKTVEQSMTEVVQEEEILRARYSGVINIKMLFKYKQYFFTQTTKTTTY